MKHSLFILLLALFGTFICEAQSSTNELNNVFGKSVQGYAISIVTKTNRYAPEQPIVLTLTLKNAGKENILFWRGGGGALQFYDVNVLLPNKESAPPTLYGVKRMEKVTATGFLASAHLLPGEETSDKIPLSRLFDN